MNNNDEKEKHQSTRRKLITTVALGSGVYATSLALPRNWAKPVVRTVLLPAHAQMTQVETEACTFETCEGFFETNGDEMTISLCVILIVDAPEDQCQGSPNCVLRIGGEELPESSSSVNPDNNCEFSCCWIETGIPRLSGPVTVEAQIGDTAPCELALGSIPDSEDADGSFV